MARKVFYSFHYKPDNWRAAQVRNAGVVEGNTPVADNEWEQITRGGDAAIERWIDGEFSGKSCVVVLIGRDTAGRKWITHEIVKGWNDGKGAAGVYVHNLKNSDGHQTTKGQNPFDYVTLNRDKSKLSSIVKAHDPPYSDSKQVYDYIKENLADWVEEAIEIRNNY